MRVGLVVYGPLDRRSGGYVYDAELVERLRAAGDAVEVCSLPDGSLGRHLLSNVRPGVRRRLASLAESVDVVVQDELCHPSLAWVNGRIEGAPVVALVHHLRTLEYPPGWRRGVREVIEGRYLRSVDAYLATSEPTLRTVRRRVDGGPMGVARPGRDRYRPDVVAPETVRARATRGPLRVLFLGSVTPRKGVAELVEGLSRVGGDWRLTVVGDTTVAPEYVASVRAATVREGLEGRVQFTGALDDGGVATELAEAHLLAVPSFYEGYGIAYAEAMTFGLPVVAAAAGGAAGFVSDRENGFLVDPRDPGEIADAVGPLCRDRGRLARLGVAAADTARQLPTWAETAAEARRFLRSVAE